jgi:hypothetical protein
MTPEQIAEAAHEMNRLWCRAHGDMSHLPWADAPDWQRESILAGVQAIIANPYLTPCQSHRNWMDRKIADGWTWGEVKDVDAKTHPCIMPYEDLPDEQRAKDLIFTEVVKTLLAATRGNFVTVP